MNNQETRNLLKNTIPASPQSLVTSIKYPCVGFCYMAINNIDKLVDLYNAKNNIEYNYLIVDLIKSAAERKKTNINIHQDGEYIDQDSVSCDFKNIVDKLEFCEMNTLNANSLLYTKNHIYLTFIEMDYKDYLIVNRSSETFLIIKLDLDSFLIVDSHKDIHGTVNLDDAIQYITRYDIYKGLIQLGYIKKI